MAGLVLGKRKALLSRAWRGVSVTGSGKGPWVCGARQPRRVRNTAGSGEMVGAILGEH